MAPPGGTPHFGALVVRIIVDPGPKKGVFGGPKMPPGGPRAPRAPPPEFPPRAPRAPRAAPPGGPPPGPLPGTPHMGPPEGYPQTAKYGTAMVVPMTWRSIGARTPCSSSRSPCGVSAARCSSTGHGDRSDLALRARPQDRHVVGRAARVVVGSDDSMSPTLATCHPFVLACGHFGRGRRFASPLLPCRRRQCHPGRLTARPIGSPKAARSTIARCCRLKP